MILQSIAQKAEKTEKIVYARLTSDGLKRISEKVKYVMFKKYPFLRTDLAQTFDDYFNECFFSFVPKYGWSFENNFVYHFNKSTNQIDQLTEKQFIYCIVLKFKQILFDEFKKVATINLVENDIVKEKMIRKYKTKFSFVPFENTDSEGENYLNSEIANQIVDSFRNDFDSIEFTSLKPKLEKEIAILKLEGTKTFQLERLLFLIDTLEFSDDQKVIEAQEMFESGSTSKLLFDSVANIRVFKNTCFALNKQTNNFSIPLVGKFLEKHYSTFFRKDLNKLRNQLEN